MTKIPTLRSYYNFRQFEQVFQKLAHEIAMDAVKNMDKGRVRITLNGKRVSEVSINSGGRVINFYAKHLTYSHQPNGSHAKWWGFDVEEKLYTTSDHSTKISFFSPEVGVRYDADYEKSIDTKKTEAEKVRREKKILKFIEKLMADANIEPVPRFELAKIAHSK